MKSLMVTCPECGHEFALEGVIQHDIENRLRKELEGQLSKRERELKVKAESLQLRESETDTSVETEVKRRLPELQQEALKEARDELRVEMEDISGSVKELKGKLKDAQESELEVRKRMRRMEEEKGEADLQLQRQLDEEKKKLQTSIETNLNSKFDIVKNEYEEKIRGLTEQISHLNQRAHQGSQQLQGEAQEVALEHILKDYFQNDRIEPVKKGKSGADILQYVRGTNGKDCGLIIWESKRAKSWSNDWTRKLRADQREAKADIAVLVTQSLPDDVRNFQIREGVIITDFSHAVPLSSLLRVQIEALSRATNANSGRAEKEAMVYDYILSNEFRQRIQGAVEAIVSAHEDIEREKRALTKIWNKREMELKRALLDMADVYGSMQGIIGSALQEIPSLDMPNEGKDRDS